MTNHPPPEPVGLTPVERIFKRLSATYGASWDRALGHAPIGDVLSVWGHELSGFLQSRDAMQAVAWALENLPERCPNPIEFRNLCRAAPAAAKLQIEGPKASAERVRAELEKLAPLLKTAVAPAGHGPKDWARRILARQAAGNPVGPYALQAARAALGLSRPGLDQPVHGSGPDAGAPLADALPEHPDPAASPAPGYGPADAAPRHAAA